MKFAMFMLGEYLGLMLDFLHDRDIIFWWLAWASLNRPLVTATVLVRF